MEKNRIFSIRKLKTGIASVAIGTTLSISVSTQVSASEDYSNDVAVSEDISQENHDEVHNPDTTETNEYDNNHIRNEEETITNIEFKKDETEVSVDNEYLEELDNSIADSSNIQEIDEIIHSEISNETDSTINVETQTDVTSITSDEDLPNLEDKSLLDENEEVINDLDLTKPINIISASLNKSEFVPGEIAELTAIFEGPVNYLDVNYISDNGVELYNATYNIQNIGNGLSSAKLEFLMPNVESRDYQLDFIRIGDKNENYVTHYSHNFGFDINFKLNNPSVSEEIRPKILSANFVKDIINNKENTYLELISEFGYDVDYVDAVLVDDQTGISNQYAIRWNQQSENYGKHEVMPDGNVKTTLVIDSESLPSGVYRVKRILYIDKYSQYFLNQDIAASLELTAYNIIEEITESTEILFNTIYEENPNMLVGQTEVSQQGVNGLVNIIEEVTYLRDKETSREYLGESIINPIDRIIQVGTKEFKAEVIPKTILFETIYVENDELMIGEENEVIAGVDGTRELSYKVTYIKGKEVSRELISSEITTAPVNRVIEVGTKEIKEETEETPVSYEIKYVESAELLIGEEQVTQEGKDGILQTTYEVTFVNGREVFRKIISDQVITDQVTKIIVQGTREVKEEIRTESVAFETERVENPDLLVGEEIVSQVGVDGVGTIIENVTYVKGQETNREVISNEIITAPITEIIQVGTKEIKTEVISEIIPFETEYIQNDELPVGEENELASGVNGSRELTYEIILVKGEEHARELISSEITLNAVNRVVEVGSKEKKEITVETTMPYEIEYVDSADLLVGERNITQKGKDGLLSTVYEVTYINGEEVSRVELSSEVIVETINQIVVRGIREVKEEVRTKIVPFDTERVENPDILVGEEKVSQAGVNGERTITENVHFVAGEEVGREVVKDEITTESVKEIIQVGVKEINPVKEIEVKVEEISEVLEFDTEYIDNAEWLVEVEKVLTPGANGEVLVTYEITYVNGNEVDRKELSRVVLVAPTTEVIEKGTKIIEKPDNSVDDNHNNIDDGKTPTIPEVEEPKGDNKEVSETPEESDDVIVDDNQDNLGDDETPTTPETDEANEDNKKVSETPEESEYLETIKDYNYQDYPIKSATVGMFGQDKLPETGEEKQYAIFGAVSLSILAGLGLIAPRKKYD